MTSSADTLTPAATSHPRLRRRLGHDAVDLTRVALWIVSLALIGGPIAALIILAVSDNHLPLLFEGDVVEAGVSSLVSATTSAVGAVAIGTALALLVDRSTIAGRTWLRMIALSPLVVPPFVGAIAWIGVLGPMAPINQAWTQAFGSPLWNVYGGDGVIFLLTVHSYPIAYIIVSAALRRVPADLELAARIGGAAPARVIGTITVPLIAPAMLSAFTLTAVSNLADFGIPAIIGLPERYMTLSTLVYRYVQSGTVAAPLEIVASIGAVLLVLAVLAVAIDALLSRRHVELDSSASRPAPLELGRARLPVTGIAWAAVLALTVLPLFALATQSLVPAPGIPLTFDTITFDNIVHAVTAPHTLDGALTSIALSVGAAIICGVLGLAVGVIVTRTRSRANGGLRTIMLAPQAIPGLVIAVAWLIIAPHIGLFNTPWLILCAYVSAFLALVVQAVVAPLSGIPGSAEESARVSGAGRARALIDISWRLGTPAALAGAVLVALTAVREVTISVLLLAPGAQTLGVTIFSLQQAGAYNAASALSLIITVLGLAGLGLATRTQR